MKLKNFASLLILSGMCFGCDEPETEPVVMTGCTVQCAPGQICKSNVCYNTCDSNFACMDIMLQCVNHMCIKKDLVCVPDTRRCSDDARGIEVCRDGSGYVLESVCAVDSSCSSGLCIKNACEDGTKRCSNNNVEICKNQSFTLFSECDAPQVCKEGAFVCEDPIECTDGVKKCDSSGNVMICSDGHWASFKACPAGFACDTAKLDCVDTSVCETGSRKCSDNQVLICANSKWMNFMSCTAEQTCNNGECVDPVCTGEQKGCIEQANTSFIQICVNNKFEQAPCMSGHVCLMNNGEPECVVAKCSNGAYKCEDNVLYKCMDNDFVVEQACSETESCNAVSMGCVPNCGNELLESNEECDGNQIKPGLTCESKIPNTIGQLKCTAECTVDASGCTSACEEGANFCDGQKFRECIDKSWTTTDCAAAGQACSATGCYTPNFSGTWDYNQDFEGLEAKTIYTSLFEFSDNNTDWVVKGRTDPIDNTKDYGIDGNVSVILHANKSTYIKVEHLPRKAKKIGFNWRSWGGNNDTGTLDIIVNGSKRDSLQFIKADTDTREYELDLVLPGDSIELSLVKANSGRIVIDNVRWIYE